MSKEEKIVFSTGKVIEPNRGLIGLSPDFEIGEGYDSTLPRHEEFLDIYESDSTFILTKQECRELCEIMIKRWQDFLTTLA